MKTILIVTGVILVIAFIPIIISIFVMYKRSVEIEKEIDRKIKEYEDA